MIAGKLCDIVLEDLAWGKFTSFPSLHVELGSFSRWAGNAITLNASRRDGRNTGTFFSLAQTAVTMKKMHNAQQNKKENTSSGNDFIAFYQTYGFCFLGHPSFGKWSEVGDGNDCGNFLSSICSERDSGIKQNSCECVCVSVSVCLHSLFNQIKFKERLAVLRERCCPEQMIACHI